MPLDYMYEFKSLCHLALNFWIEFHSPEVQLEMVLECMIVLWTSYSPRYYKVFVVVGLNYLHLIFTLRWFYVIHQLYSRLMVWNHWIMSCSLEWQTEKICLMKLLWGKYAFLYWIYYLLLWVNCHSRLCSRIPVTG